jgi:integrase
MAQDMNYGTMHRMDLNVKNTHDVDLPLLRKVFLWQTWTGMSYADLVAYDDVRRTVLQKDFSGRDSLIYNRAKNGELAIVIFFDEARKILDSLEGRVNPRCSYSTYNRGIKRILNYYGIETDKASTHLGRHLFGCRMLMKGMSIESISRMMGHTSISQTEKVYAKIDLGTIQADWDRIKQNEKIGTDIAV